jgi:hypothetical protein
MEEAQASIEQQIAAEKAAALGRSGRKLRSALDSLRRFDEIVCRGGRVFDPVARAKLVEIAGDAFWSYVVQREAMGLMDSEYIGREYGVPPDVWRAMRPRLRRYQG